MKRIVIFLLLASSAFGVDTVINAFNAGELSPMLDGRSDLQKYYSGCKTLENMLVMSYGGATRRPGTKYIASVKTASKKVRLVPFEYSIEQAYILELGDQYIRFYKDGAKIQSGGSPYEIVTTYGEADLFKLQFIQSADVMYIVHPGYHPKQLWRTAHTSWIIEDVDFERGPFLDENETDTTITPSATTGNITLTASSDLFNSGHVGSLWQITHKTGTQEISGSGTGNFTSSNLTIQLGRPYYLTTTGTWTGTVELQRSYDGGTTWGIVYSRSSEDNTNISYSGSEDVNDAIYRVQRISNDTDDCRYRLAAHGFDLNGVVRITAVNSTTSADAAVIVDPGGTSATKLWAEGAWNAYRGYPSGVAFYEERLVFAATSHQPQTIWFSETDAWTSFRNDTGDSDAMTFTIAADQVNAIRWMIPKQSLILGTSGAEWTIGASSPDEALTPTNVKAVRHSTYGSADIQAIAVNNVVLFPQRQSRKIRELTYSFELDNYVAPDMTVLSEHITKDGIVNMAYQETPDSVLWCVLAGGDIAGMTYNREQDVVGWHRHVTDGDFESVAIIPGNGEDEIWTSVKRTVNGSEVRYIEQFQPRDCGSDQADIYFVDCGITYDGGQSRNITSITQANPPVVTVSTWPTDADSTDMADGDHVIIKDVSGMTELNNLVFEVANVNIGAKTFTLKDETRTVDYDTTGFAEYSSGGTVRMVTKSLGGLAHLEGEAITVCSDGAWGGNYTVSGGTVTIDEFGNTIHAGLAYTSVLQPMNLNVPLQDGTMMGRTRRIFELTARFYQTLSCNAGPTLATYTPIEFRSASDALNQVPPLYSGDKTIAWRGSYEKKGNIILQTSDPLPMTVLSLMPRFEVTR